MDLPPTTQQGVPERDTGMDYLLGLDGEIQVQNEEGYWLKFEVGLVEISADRPYGIQYSLTLHATRW